VEFAPKQENAIMKKRTSFLSVLMILLVVVLASVSPSCYTVTTEVTQEPPPTQPPAPVHLVGWRSSGAADDMQRYLLDQCGVTYQIIEADYWDTLQAMFAAGEEFDILYMNPANLPSYAQSGYLAPVDESAWITLDEFIEPLVKAFTFEGTPYGVPRDLDAQALFYNKDLFAQAELEEPNDDWTWEDLEKASWYIKDYTGANGFSVPASDYVFAPFVFQNGGWIMSEDYLETYIDSPEAIGAGEFYAKARENGWAVVPEDVGAGWQGEAFGRSEVAMMQEGYWAQSYLSEQFPNLNYGAVHPPAGPVDEGNLVWAEGYAVSAYSSSQPDAWKAIACLTSEEAQSLMLESGVALPSRWSFEGHPYFTDNPVANAVFGGAKDSSPYGWGPYHGFVVTVIEEALRRVLYDEQSVEESFWQAAEEIRGIIAE
jgi:multiple sugar transport system substrate-binding protein